MKDQSRQAPGANPLARSNQSPGAIAQGSGGGYDPWANGGGPTVSTGGGSQPLVTNPGASMGSSSGGLGANSMGSVLGGGIGSMGNTLDPGSSMSSSSFGGNGAGSAGINSPSAGFGGNPVTAGMAPGSSMSASSFGGNGAGTAGINSPGAGFPSGAVSNPGRPVSLGGAQQPLQAKSLTQPATPYSTMPQGDPASGTGSSANPIADPASAFSGLSAPSNTGFQSGYTGSPSNGPAGIPSPSQVQSLYSDPSNWSGTAIPGSAPASAAANPSNPGASPASTNSLSNEWGSVTGAVAPSGQIQNAFNTSNVPGLVGGDSLQSTMQQAQDAAYKNATGYLDPQWQNQQTTLQNQLANQGVMQNSEAWNKAMDDFGRQKQFAYQQAQSNAVNQGLAAQGQLFNQGLQSNQNAFGQDLAQGQFGNAAQQQGYQQNLSNANFANSAQNQIATQGLQNRQIASQLEGQRYAANAAGASASASAAASMANVQAQIQAQQQQNQFNNSLSLRNQGINELLLQQQNPLQMLNGLSGGQGVAQPNFTSSPGANVGSTDIAQMIQNAFNGQMSGYNAQTGAANSNNAAMASIIAAMICDRRLKKNIRKIGMLTSGCALYEFEYLWGEKAVGPMADEVELVRPEAVFTLSTGHKVVNFARL